jgi:glyoxylase-like metal-dependent hydrolase (beta-lactamase superfamily II)
MVDNTVGISMAVPLPTTSFVSRRINSSTFLVIEDDSYNEQPQIYIKIYDNHLLITDTGCNSPRSKLASITSLRTYLETFPLPLNNYRPLNPGGEKKYVIICSHCHYDHILGIPQFLSANPTIIASSFDKSFILDDLPTSSLCKYMDIATPKYTISHWANHMQYFSLSPKTHFRIQFLHIPGHTPCSLSWYDIDEHHLYIGDTFYERKQSTLISESPRANDTENVPNSSDLEGAIIFPQEGGNWIQYMSSLEMLLSFVIHQNNVLERRHDSGHDGPPRVKVGAGHNTFAADAEVMIREVKELFERIIRGKVPVWRSWDKRGVLHDLWVEEDSASYSVVAPRRLMVEAREHFKLGDS